ncbi:hypothetical protein ACFW2D_09195 [Streptomyces sp. NPDC058914]|uniref:hypothetical protein n=1 Tax=Streptomyces TaxID=1883 RepID=UPI0036C0E345
MDDDHEEQAMTHPAPHEPEHTRSPRAASTPPLISVRAALVFLLAALVGLLAGALVYAARQAWADAAGAGLAAAGGALPLLNQIIEGE